MKELSSDFSLSDYIGFEMEVAMLQSPVDVEVIAGRQESRQKAIKLIVGSGERRSDGDCE